MEMKRRFYNSVSVFTLFFLVLLTSCTNREGRYDVRLCATNDLHGRVFDSLYVGDGTHDHSLANVSYYLKGLRGEIGESNLALVDLGDALQGDNALFYANYIDTANSGKHLFTRVMEYLKYDVLVVGNHDIEAGHPVYDKIAAESSIPYLAANAIRSATSEPYFKPYQILNKGGVRFAVIGMTNPNIKKWLGEELWSGMEFCPIEDIAQKLVDKIVDEENPDIVVLAIHAGLGDGEGKDVENPARFLAAKLNNVDVILASHDHRATCEKIWNGKDSTLLMEGAHRARFLMDISVGLEFEDGEVVAKEIGGKLVPMSGTPVDKEYLATFREDFLKTKEFTNQEIALLPDEINTSDAFFGPSDYIDLIHTVQLKYSDADISFAAPLTYNGKVASGIMRYNDLFTLYPFENQLYVVNLTGSQVKDCLEYSYNTWINILVPDGHLMKIKENGKGGYTFVNMAFNFDSAAGIDYDVNVEAPYGERVIIRSMADGTPFECDKIYKVAMSSYRANGGGDLLTLGAGIPRDSLDNVISQKSEDIRGMLYDYFKSGSKEIVRATWNFIPEKKVERAIKRDRELLFGKK